MNICNPIRAVLIIGLLGCSLVEGNFFTEKEKYLAIFKEDCDKYGGPYAYDVFNDRVEYISEYLTTSLNTSEFGKIDVAGPQGNPHNAIKAFCSLVPQLETVIETIVNAAQPCIKPQDRESPELTHNLTTSFFDFLCRNDGERIAMFIATGGMECIVFEREALEACVPDSPHDSSTLEVTDADVCRQGRDFQSCVVRAFSRCYDKTPANIVQKLFDLLFQVFSCEKTETGTLSPPTINDEECDQNLDIWDTNFVLILDRDRLPSGKEKLMYLVQQKCLKNGGPTAYSSVMQSFMHVTNCAQSKIATNYPGIRLGFDPVNSPQNSIAYCDYVADLEQCGKPFTDSIKVCLDSEEKKTVDILTDMSRSSQEFICRREGEALREFVQAGSSQCFESKHQGLAECTTPLRNNYVPSGSEFARIEQSLVINDQDCAIAHDFQKCVVGVLRECENQTIANFIDALCDAWLEKTPCEKLSKTQKSLGGPALNIGGKVTSSGPKSYASFEAKCNWNGGPNAYAIAGEGMVFFDASFQQLIALPKSRKVDSRPGDRSLELTATMQCHRVPLFKGLVTYLKRSIQPCFQVEEVKFLQMIEDVISATLDLVCTGDGKTLAMLRNSANEKCRESDLSIVLQCARQTFGFDSSYVSGILRTFATYDEPLAISTEHCTNLENFKNCCFRTVENCEHPGTLHFLDQWFASIEKIVPCESSLPGETFSTTEWYPSSTDHPQLGQDFGTFPGSIPIEATWGMIHGFSQSDFSDRCLRNGGIAAYEATKETPKYIADGVKLLQSNLIQLNADVNAARPRGELDVVFMKYCYEIPALEKSIKYIADSVKPCLDEESRKHVDVIYKTIESSLRFLCQNEGDRLAKFVAADGVECIGEKHQAIQSCTSSYVHSYVPYTGSFILGGEQCLGLRRAQRCIIDAIKECESKTPAKTIEDLTNTVLIGSPCSDILGSEVF